MTHPLEEDVCHYLAEVNRMLAPGGTAYATFFLYESLDDAIGSARRDIRCRTLRVVCMDMWAPYANLVRDYATNAQILFDRFHIVKHLPEAVDAARRELWRQLTAKQRVNFKGTRWLLLKNPWNLNDHQKERLSTLVRWNTPLVRAWYLKEASNCSGSRRSHGAPSNTSSSG
jgi:transposase